MRTLILCFSIVVFFSCQSNSQKRSAGTPEPASSGKGIIPATVNMPEGHVPDHLAKVVKSDEEWKAELTEMEYYVLREQGTERAFSGDLWDNKESGIYHCKGCDLPLFDSGTKFKSGTGWPSYYRPIGPDHIEESVDHHLGYARTEVHCAKCGGHLGHVFKDGPEPTGLRYCINSVSLKFFPIPD